MTLAAVAEAAGVGSPSPVHAWENGQVPSSDNLARVCLALGVSGHWLLTGEGPMEPEMESRAIEALQEICEIATRVCGPMTQPEGEVPGSNPADVVRDGLRRPPRRRTQDGTG